MWQCMLGRVERQAEAKNLVDLGRRLSSMNFVMFTLATDDVWRRCITPISLTSQISDMGALAVFRQCLRTLDGLKEASTDLMRIEDWWSITALISTMVSLKDKGNQDMYRYRLPGGTPAHPRPPPRK